MVLLTGLEYVLISPKYRSIKAKKIDQITNVLITYGASDPTNKVTKSAVLHGVSFSSRVDQQ